MVKSILSVFVMLFTLNAMAQNCPADTHTGQATYYDASGPGNCSLPEPLNPLYSVAINPVQYDTSFTCGACLQITSAKGSITGIVDELCPACAINNLDIGSAAALILDTAEVITPIQWKIIGCPVAGPVKFAFQGSNPFYTKVQVRNHRYPVAKLEYRSPAGVYTVLAKTSDNFFLAQTGLGSGPYDFRLTDMLGDTILETGVPLLTNNDSVFTGANQFVECITSGIAENTSDVINVRVFNSQANQLTIVNGNYSALNFRVYDILGRTIATGDTPANAQQTVAVTQPGVYIVTCANAKAGRQTKRVVVR